MDTSANLPPEPNHNPQLPIKLINNPWQKFSVLLIIVNLLCLWLYNNKSLIPLTITDLIAIVAYNKKQSPPWIVLLLALLVLNIIFFGSIVLETNRGTAMGVAAIVLIPLSLFLVVIDFFAVLFFVLNSR
jgi:hypothetical protein